MPDAVASLRRAARALTRAVGALGPLPGGDLPLTEARVLSELATRDDPTARDVAALLGLDEGHLSRTLARFEDRGWLDRVPDPRDARRRALRLTPEGRDVFAALDRGARDRVAGVLAVLPATARRTLGDAAEAMATALDAPPPPVAIRRYGPGDLGWIVERHGALYAAEHGLDGRFEALVARVCATFLDTHDDRREAVLILHRDGARLGSVMVIREDDATARLRLLLLEPAARGGGLGARLVAEAERFARAAGYRHMTLWTMGHLLAARAAYARAGWTLAATTPEEGYGRRFESEVWERAL